MKKLVYLSLASLLLLSSEALVSEQSFKTENVVYVNRELEDVKKIAQDAGKKILEIRESGRLISKDELLPNGKLVRQTNADIEGSQYIIDQLTKLYPTYGIITQDLMDEDPTWYLKESIWLINAIDGTKEFEKGNDDFHVQIGLLRGEQPIIGVSYYPVTDTYVWAVQGQGAWIEKDGKMTRLSAVGCCEKILLKSSSYAQIQPYFQQWDWTPSQVTGGELSTTGRILAMIRGEASLYISLGASPMGKEKKGGVWNYGANALIASESGLILTTLGGNPIDLRQPEALLVEGIILTNDPVLYDKVIESDWHLNNPF